MANTVVVGTQWGDEGKGKVVDMLTARADLVVRFQGGANAGHTLLVEGKQFIFSYCSFRNTLRRQEMPHRQWSCG